MSREVTRWPRPPSSGSLLSELVSALDDAWRRWEAGDLAAIQSDALATYGKRAGA